MNHRFVPFILALVAASVIAPPAAATPEVRVDRLAGTDRFQTALTVSLQPAFDDATRVAVVGGDAVADALAAGSLGVPVVLTPADRLAPEARQAIEAKRSHVSEVLVIGGTTAVSPSVEAEIRALGVTTTRVAGADRFATAVAVAQAPPAPPGTVAGVSTAVVASGSSFPDALAAAPLAGGADLPLLLSAVDSTPAATVAELDRRGVTRVLLVGGTAAVSTAAEVELRAGGRREVIRLQGPDRAATAAAVAAYAYDTLSFPGAAVVLANGFRPADGVVAGGLGSALRTPVLLVLDVLPDPTAAALDHYGSISLGHLWVTGGTSAISDAVVNAAKNATQTVQND